MSAELTELRRELRRHRIWLVKLATALYTHARTDLAPDAALPALRELVGEMRMPLAKTGRKPRCR